MVRSESNLKMITSLDASGETPGTIVNLRAVIAERSHPDDGAIETAHERYPDGLEKDMHMTERGRGLYEGSFTATREGVYECLMRGRGRSGQGELFTREQMRTAHIWRTSTGGNIDRRSALEIDFRHPNR
jgi:hypothetical protein